MIFFHYGKVQRLCKKYLLKTVGHKIIFDLKISTTSVFQILSNISEKYFGKNSHFTPLSNIE